MAVLARGLGKAHSSDFLPIPKSLQNWSYGSPVFIGETGIPLGIRKILDFGIDSR